MLPYGWIGTAQGDWFARLAPLPTDGLEGATSPLGPSGNYGLRDGGGPDVIQGEVGEDRDMATVPSELRPDPLVGSMLRPCSWPKQLCWALPRES